MKVGFIGLGIMGRPMAKNLIKAGHELVVCDFNQKNVDDVVACGAKQGRNGAEIAPQVEVVITEGGVAEGATKDTVIIDMSSIDPVESQKIGAELAAKGIEFLDCPVSGGEPKAIDGTLSIMCGGKKEVWDKYKPLLDCMGGSVVYVGPIGSGNVAKLANQMIVAINIGACAEAFTFAKKMGTDPRLVYDAIRGGLAGSTVMDAKVPMMLAGNYNPGFRIDLHIKDLTNALNASHAINMPVPLTANLMEVMQELKNHDEGACDHDDIVRYYERMTGTSIVEK